MKIRGEPDEYPIAGMWDVASIVSGSPWVLHALERIHVA